MQRPDQIPGRVYVTPAESVSISHGANLNNQRTLAPNSLPEIRIAGHTNTKIDMSFAMANKFLTNNPSLASTNLGSGIFTYLTGTSGTNLTIGGSIFSGCYLDQLSIDIAPLQPAKMSASFTCISPPTGLPMIEGTTASNLPIHDRTAYGHFAVVSGGANYSSGAYSNISYSLDFKRTYSYAVSKRIPNAVFLDEVTKKLQIKATNISTFINESGASSSFSIDLKNQYGELILPSGTLSTSSRGLVSAQNLSVSPPNILMADVTIDELMI